MSTTQPLVEGSIMTPEQATFNVEETHSQNSKPPRASLLGLPLELRFQIYEWIFHIPTDFERPCTIMKLDDSNLRNVGCRCGERLSTASKQIYDETRDIFYNSATFVFPTAQSCHTFLDTIGQYRLQITSLDIKYTNAMSELSFLRGAFEYLRENTKLLRLRLTIEGGPRGFPIYIPHRGAERDAMIWDIGLRPLSHPLADLKALRRLEIAGHPGTGEMEEVLCKASQNVEALAVTQQRYTYQVVSWGKDPTPVYAIESRKESMSELPTGWCLPWF